MAISWNNTTKTLTVSGGTAASPESFVTQAALNTAGVTDNLITASSNGTGPVITIGNALFPNTVVTVILKDFVADTAENHANGHAVWTINYAGQLTIDPGCTILKKASATLAKSFQILSVVRTTPLLISMAVVSAAGNKLFNASQNAIKGY